MNWLKCLSRNWLKDNSKTSNWFDSS
jgi:hypothetical protein